MRAKGRTKRTPGKMNGLEKAWSKELEMQRLRGEIVSWRFEPVSLRLAKGSSYKPDFMWVDADGFVGFDETKGFMREAAHVRLKVAADAFPEFVFRLVKRIPKKDGGGFAVKVYGPELEGV